ncbi:MAG: hypothetical protein WBE76_19440 [Terracidiphilus sp.]
MRVALVLGGPMLLAMAGCGGGGVSANSTNPAFSISPGMASIDTNCTGCNATNSGGMAVEQFSAALSGGGAASVTWTVTGGDANTGTGTIDRTTGQYTPPSYLTADSVQVMVTATLNSNSSTTATAVMTVTPGFLQPLKPENVALGANGTVTVTGYLAEAGGSTGINYSVSNSPAGSGGGQGSLGMPSCQRSSNTFTNCSVTYSAPSTVASSGATYIVATVGTSASKTSAVVLVNAAGIASNPATHEAQIATPVALGSSGGNNNDYDTQGSQIVDCCSGTLGALLEGSDKRQYLLSNNHVLARSDQATVGDLVVQPGLIDNNCTPNGEGPGTTVVGSLTGWLPLKSAETNADAAIAQVAAGAVSPTGDILELGAKQPDGTLAAAPPGISSSGGKGETASLEMKVAKSGRTTGLTCAAISALNLDVSVDYYTDCAETKPYLTKTYTDQLAISGNEFSDAGDSGSLVVDTGDAEPVGLFFAGGTDASGVGQGVASPAPDVLSELNSQLGSGTMYKFAGTADHAVSCLNYGDASVAAAQERELSDEELSLGLQASAQARMLVNPSVGILGVAAGKSNDHPGEAAVIVYVDENMTAAVPAEVGGVRTMVIPTNAQAVALGSAPLTNSASGNAPPPGAELARAIAVKQQVARRLMRQNPAFFGVGVGQSLDNPREPALVIFVDRKHIPDQLPQAVAGLRTRYIVMNRLHVTRSYGVPTQSHCSLDGDSDQPAGFDPQLLSKPHSLNLN